MGNKLLLLDFDGVMTDGTKAYSSDGKCVSKSTADIDWTALKLFIAKGWKVAFISSDKFNERLCHDRGFHMYNSRHSDGTIDKAGMLKEIMLDYGVESVADVVYCGDDATDWPIMKAVKAGRGRVFSPKNASLFIFVNTESMSTRPCGGHGFMDRVLHEIFGDISESDIMRVQY
jgi:3-deoxy-D-manno-octulosonate 8-phosphate phosphatase KdsC-like HAD superfamily phosphatase